MEAERAQHHGAAAGLLPALLSAAAGPGRAGQRAAAVPPSHHRRQPHRKLPAVLMRWGLYVRRGGRLAPRRRRGPSPHVSVGDTRSIAAFAEAPNDAGADDEMIRSSILPTRKLQCVYSNG